MPRATRARWRRVPLAGFVQSDVIPTSTHALLSELHRTWARPEAAELGVFYALVAPDYAAVAESYARAAGGSAVELIA